MMTVLRSGLRRFTDAATTPVDAASLAFFRIGFGAIVAFAAIRSLAYGWVDRFFVTPDYYFSYWGFGWVQVLPPLAMKSLFALIATCGFAIALGLGTRIAAAVFFVAFTYVELIDVTNYLNHYYLLSLVGLLLVFLPTDREWSVDRLRGVVQGPRLAPVGAIWLLRLQVGVVYFYAGVAKVGSDWLLHGQPLNVWLLSRTDFPLIGPLFEYWHVALAMSWAGCLHDLLIVPLLLWRRTRLAAYVVLVSFHAITGALFTIGMFPLIMSVSALIFFPSSWPRRWLPGSGTAMDDAPGGSSGAARPSRRGATLAVAAALLYSAFQIGMPLRVFAYPGDVIWHEQGMRWSWRVMLRQKAASLTYDVITPEGRAIVVSPRSYLTAHQEREMSGQPDMILRLAHRIAEDFGPGTEVRADVTVSLNGRRPHRLIDPAVDLATIRDGIRVADWILPGPPEPPPRLGR